MSEVKMNNGLGLLLKQLMEQQSLSMRKLGKLVGIDTATISRIINGKRQANPEHLQKLARGLGVPVADLFRAAGYPIEQQNEGTDVHDLHMAIDSVQDMLETSSIYPKNFTIENVEQQLAYCKEFGQTKEGKESILKGFEEKIDKVGSMGPFIDVLKNMFLKFSMGKGTPAELVLMGAALLYFILPVDVIPDYIFPIGYLDDAIAVNMVLELLKRNATD